MEVLNSFNTHLPSLDELVTILQDGLKAYFSDVTVQLVDCPDFSQKPFKLAVNGLHGNTSIADVGGESKFDLNGVTRAIYKNNSDYPISTFGPGGGAFNVLGYCCEFMGSAKYESTTTTNSNTNEPLKLVGCACRYAFVNELNDNKGQWKEQENDDRFGLMGNFFLSQNKSGKVLKIEAKKRINKQNFTEAIRAVLLAKYGIEKPISMGGVFLINKGSAKLHIMPKYWPKEPSTDESINNEWLKYYEIKKNPLICLSVFHSYDPGLSLRMEHTHCFNLDAQDEAGHYHYDTTPEIIEYEGYFNLAEKVYKL